jgi:hypothetical protein
LSANAPDYVAPTELGIAALRFYKDAAPTELPLRGEHTAFENDCQNRFPIGKTIEETILFRA